MPEGWAAGIRGRRGSEQVPDCREGRSRTAGGGARQSEAHRLCSGRARILLSFCFGASLTRILSTANPPPRLDRKRCLPPWTNPPLSRLRGTILRGLGKCPGRRAEGRWGSGGGGGVGRPPFLALPGALLALSLFIAAAPSCLR